MKHRPDQYRNAILQGDALSVLKTLPDELVQCIVTSPPYWGLRDYGVDGQLGLEKTPGEYIDRMVEIFAEARRALRPDGTLWLNMGDSYTSGGRTTRDPGRSEMHKPLENWTAGGPPDPPGMKAKDLCCIPWTLAMALRDDGWYLRSAMPWVKRSAMPESVRDRPASALEYVFLLSKSPRYFFDMDAVRVAHKEPERSTGKMEYINTDRKAMGLHPGLVGKRPREYNPACRAWRNVDLWFESIEGPHGLTICGDEPVGLDVNPRRYREAHFATFPEKLVEPCIKAGTSEKGACTECGVPWVRVVKKEKPPLDLYTKDNTPDDGFVGTGQSRDGARRGSGQAIQNWLNEHPPKTLGWRPQCECEVEVPSVPGEMASPPPRPCIVLDPFMGSGTVAKVAAGMGRDAIGIELNMQYAAMAEKRIGQALAPSTYRRDEGQAAPLFEGITTCETSTLTS